MSNGLNAAKIRNTQNALARWTTVTEGKTPQRDKDNCRRPPLYPADIFRGVSRAGLRYWDGTAWLETSAGNERKRVVAVRPGQDVVAVAQLHTPLKEIKDPFLLLPPGGVYAA